MYSHVSEISTPESNVQVYTHNSFQEGAVESVYNSIIGKGNGKSNPKSSEYYICILLDHKQKSASLRAI